MSAVDAVVANAASVSANRMRADYLQSVANKRLLTIHDVIAAVAEPGNKALLRIGLDQLLRAQEGWGQARSSAALTRVLTFCSLPTDRATIRSLDIAWLTDPRAAGTRLAAFLDVTAGHETAPWLGFPYTPAPQLLTGGEGR